MSDVTDADRGKAVDVLASARADEIWLTDNRSDLVTHLAKALAEEREKARVPFLALADDIERGFHGYEHTEREFADLIRRAAEVTE